MSSDKITTEQRKGIHDRARTIGHNEGVRTGVNQLACYLGPEVGKLTLFALGIVIDTTDQHSPQKSRFESVDWEKLGATTLDDLQLLTPEELAATQPTSYEGATFAEAVAGALAVFNLTQ